MGEPIRINGFVPKDWNKTWDYASGWVRLDERAEMNGMIPATLTIGTEDEQAAQARTTSHGEPPPQPYHVQLHGRGVEGAEEGREG